MVEKIVLDYLTANLSELCAMEVPEPPTPQRYVVIEKTGSTVKNLVPSANIAIQSCAATLLDAANLNEAVKAAMPGLMADSRIAACKLDTDYNFTDPSTKTYRYQAIYRITYMEVYENA